MSGRLSPTSSLRRIATAAWVSAILALLLGTVGVWIGFNGLLDARERLVDRIEPALVTTSHLRSSLIDQETGIRGYALTRDDRLLAPYESGRAAQAQAEAALRALFVHDALRPTIERHIDEIHTAMRLWRTENAQPILDGPLPAIKLDLAFVRSKASFDQVRAGVDRLEADLDAGTAKARTKLTRTTIRLLGSVGVAFGLVAAAALGVSWVLRRQVVDPINDLVDSADAVARGRLAEPIEARGPPEIERLARRISEMRDRIVADFDQAETARIELDRRATELARSNADLEQFAYVASHDLQEPLRKIAAFCQLLEQRYADELDERGLSYIAFAVDGAKRMQALISDLLDFSRVANADRQRVPCDLSALASEVLAGLHDELQGAAITVGPLPTVEGDPTLLRALFHNLITNAVKYRRPDVTPVISVTARHDDRRNAWRFDCTDNGIGIEQAYRERVFVIFQRLHGRDEFEGTGIGLALCKKIVEFHGGDIWVAEPVQPEGTTIRWTLPVLAGSATMDSGATAPVTSASDEEPAR